MPLLDMMDDNCAFYRWCGHSVVTNYNHSYTNRVQIESSGSKKKMPLLDMMDDSFAFIDDVGILLSQIAIIAIQVEFKLYWIASLGA